MRLTVIDGSPRGAKGNSMFLAARFLAGFGETAGNTHEVFHLVQARHRAEQVAAFAAAEHVLLAFPLYSDAMPSIVKAFVEDLAPLCGRPGNPRLLGFVQSGFIEAYHSRCVEHYLERLARRLGSPYLGTMVKGGGEGVQVMPAWMTRGTFAALRALGRSFGRTGALDPEQLARLARPERLTLGWRAGLTVLQALGMTNSYWDHALKKNGVFEHRFARPYATAAEQDAAWPPPAVTTSSR
jgi:hypothetical protein